jgi:hypothetical protein
LLKVLKAMNISLKDFFSEGFDWFVLFQYQSLFTSSPSRNNYKIKFCRMIWF